MNIFFNDYKLPNVISCEVRRVTRNTMTEYNADGDMLIDVVSRKYSLMGYTIRDGIKCRKIKPRKSALLQYKWTDTSNKEIS